MTRVYVVLRQESMSDPKEVVSVHSTRENAEQENAWGRKEIHVFLLNEFLEKREERISRMNDEIRKAHDETTKTIKEKYGAI